MKAKDVMTDNPICCTPETSLKEVSSMMVENDCGAIPVVQDQESWKAVGIVTDRDIVIRAVAEGKNPLDLRARDCMTSDTVTVRQDADLEECISLMENYKLRRILVTDDAGGCIGIVSQADVARHAPEEEVGEVVEQVSRP